MRTCILLKFCKYFISHACTLDKTDHGASPRTRLVVEDREQRRRIVSITHEDGHSGVNRTNDTIAAKYYWPGLFMDGKQQVIYYRCYIDARWHDLSPYFAL